MKTTYYNDNKTTFGLSSDTKETTGVPNGAVFVEMDTGDVYFFDEENGQWLLI